MTLEPNPVNPIGWLIILLLGLFFFAAVPVSSTTQALPDEPPGRPARPSVVAPPVVEGRPLTENGELLGVESVEMVVRGSAPPQVVVLVSGYWPNGCTAEPRIDKAIDGSHIMISISRVIPPELMCTMVMQAYDIEIDISDLLVEGMALRSGQYTMDINGVRTTVNF